MAGKHVAPGTPTQVAHPWRAVIRTTLEVTVALAALAPFLIDAIGVSASLPIVAGVLAVAAAITRDTRLVIVCSPNNPTGPCVTEAELEEFLAQVPEDVLVVFDEAYVEFVRDPEAADGLAVYRRHPNVVLLRTFSKAYGLAGLRVGYAVARPQLATSLRSCVIPFAVTELAARAAISSLEAKDALLERVADLVTERGRLLAGLRELGYDVPDTQANFVWLGLGERAQAFAEAADARGLSVRPFPGEGVRVSIEAPEANARLLEVARAFRDTVA